MQYQRQHTFNDCGPACLVMLASCYQVTVDLSTMRRLCSMNLWGTNLEGLLIGSRKLGLQANAFKGDVTEKNCIYYLPFPCIAHVTLSWLGIKFKHYVVVSHTTEHGIEIYDPNPKVGIKKLSHIEFLSMWTGYIVVITPINP
jgi:ATP-binding cassette subfamily B protein